MKTGKQDADWRDVSASCRLRQSDTNSARFAKKFFFCPEDGRIFRRHYTVAPDPFSIVPKDLLDWPEVD